MTAANNAGDLEHKTSARARIDTDGGSLNAAREHREDLRALADTDLPAARWAERLLAIIDAEDAESGGELP